MRSSGAENRDKKTLVATTHPQLEAQLVGWTEGDRQRYQSTIDAMELFESILKLSQEPIHRAEQLTGENARITVENKGYALCSFHGRNEGGQNFLRLLYITYTSESGQEYVVILSATSEHDYHRAILDAKRNAETLPAVFQRINENEKREAEAHAREEKIYEAQCARHQRLERIKKKRVLLDDNQMGAFDELVTKGGHQARTLVGPAGAGKTIIGIEYLLRAAAECEQKTLYVVRMAAVCENTRDEFNQQHIITTTQKGNVEFHTVETLENEIIRKLSIPIPENKTKPMNFVQFQGFCREVGIAPPLNSRQSAHETRYFYNRMMQFYIEFTYVIMQQTAIDSAPYLTMTSYCDFSVVGKYNTNFDCDHEKITRAEIYAYFEKYLQFLQSNNHPYYEPGLRAHYIGAMIKEKDPNGYLISYRHVFFDEVQCGRAQEIWLLRRMLQSDGELVVAGDVFQCADCLMGNFFHHFGLPKNAVSVLSQTYRNPPLIAYFLKGLMLCDEHWRGSPSGISYRLSINDFNTSDPGEISIVSAGEMVEKFNALSQRENILIIVPDTWTDDEIRLLQENLKIVNSARHRVLRYGQSGGLEYQTVIVGEFFDKKIASELVECYTKDVPEENESPSKKKSRSISLTAVNLLLKLILMAGRAQHRVVFCTDYPDFLQAILSRANRECSVKKITSASDKAPQEESGKKNYGPDWYLEQVERSCCEGNEESLAYARNILRNEDNVLWPEGSQITIYFNRLLNALGEHSNNETESEKLCFAKTVAEKIISLKELSAKLAWLDAITKVLVSRPSLSLAIIRDDFSRFKKSSEFRKQYLIGENAHQQNATGHPEKNATKQPENVSHNEQSDAEDKESKELIVRIDEIATQQQSSLLDRLIEISSLAVSSNNQTVRGYADRIVEIQIEGIKRSSERENIIKLFIRRRLQLQQSHPGMPLDGQNNEAGESWILVIKPEISDQVRLYICRKLYFLIQEYLDNSLKLQRERAEASFMKAMIGTLYHSRILLNATESRENAGISLEECFRSFFGENYKDKSKRDTFYSSIPHQFFLIEFFTASLRYIATLRDEREKKTWFQRFSNHDTGITAAQIIGEMNEGQNKHIALRMTGVEFRTNILYHGTMLGLFTALFFILDDKNPFKNKREVEALIQQSGPLCDDPGQREIYSMGAEILLRRLKHTRSSRDHRKYLAQLEAEIARERKLLDLVLSHQSKESKDKPNYADAFRRRIASFYAIKCVHIVCMNLELVLQFMKDKKETPIENTKRDISEALVLVFETFKPADQQMIDALKSFCLNVFKCKLEDINALGGSVLTREDQTIINTFFKTMVDEAFLQFCLINNAANEGASSVPCSDMLQQIKTARNIFNDRDKRGSQTSIRANCVTECATLLFQLISQDTAMICRMYPDTIARFFLIEVSLACFMEISSDVKTNEGFLTEIYVRKIPNTMLGVLDEIIKDVNSEKYTGTNLFTAPSLKTKVTYYKLILVLIFMIHNKKSAEEEAVQLAEYKRFCESDQQVVSTIEVEKLLAKFSIHIEMNARLHGTYIKRLITEADQELEVLKLIFSAPKSRVFGEDYQAVCSERLVLLHVRKAVHGLHKYCEGQRRGSDSNASSPEHLILFFTSVFREMLSAFAPTIADECTRLMSFCSKYFALYWHETGGNRVATATPELLAIFDEILKKCVETKFPDLFPVVAGATAAAGPSPRVFQTPGSVPAPSRGSTGSSLVRK